MRIPTCTATVASICLLLLASGCLYEIRDEIIDGEIACVNRYRAYVSWYKWRADYKSVEHLCDFKCGFIKGYTANSSGGNGCPPTLPPPCYWKVHYQTQRGKAQANAWFDGYSSGAMAAQVDGVADLNRIVTRGGRHAAADRQPPMPEEIHGMPPEITPPEPVEDYPPPPPAPLDLVGR